MVFLTCSGRSWYDIRPTVLFLLLFFCQCTVITFSKLILAYKSVIWLLQFLFLFFFVSHQTESNQTVSDRTEPIGWWIQQISQISCSLHLFSLCIIYGLYLNFCAKNQTQMKNDRNHIADYVFKYVSITCFIFLQAMLTRYVHQFSSVVLLCLYLQDEN